MLVQKTRHVFLFLSLMTFSVFARSTDIVTLFDPVTDGLPEAITADYRGDLYVSIGTSVKKISPRGDVLKTFTLPIPFEQPNGDLVVDWDGDIFVNANGFSSEAKGIWRIRQNGDIEKFADIDPSTSGFLNGMAMDWYGNLYVSDSQAEKIYRIDPEGNVTDWLADPALGSDKPSVFDFDVGVNNLVFDRGQRNLYASNLDEGTVIKIKLRRDGSAGRIREVARDDLLRGIDGITFDRWGRLFAAINIENRIVKISRRGHVKIVEDLAIDASSNLDFPSDVVFGKGRNRFTLYISNFSVINRDFPAVLKLEQRKPWYKRKYRYFYHLLNK